MGLLLKEALKILCGSNQWAYAIFWKIGHQNPKLLIWEECYYEMTPHSVLPCVSGSKPFEEWGQCWVSSETHESQLGIREGNRVQSLMNKMMMRNNVNIVGEGVVGRAAFTGNHQWILSESYIRDAQPPQVLNDVHHQFSAGMQTVAVIPILPHGVVQLGSSLAIMENLGFVNDVKTLILQLGCIPGALLSNSYSKKEFCPKIGLPASLGTFVSVNSSGDCSATNSIPFAADNCNPQSNSLQDPKLGGQFRPSIVRQLQDNLKISLMAQTPSLSRTFSVSHGTHSLSKIKPEIKLNLPFNSDLEKGVMGTEVITENSDAWWNQKESLYNSRSEFGHQPGVGQLSSNYNSLRLMKQQRLLDDCMQHHVNNFGASNSFISSQLRADRGLIPNSDKGSATTQLPEVSELVNRMSNHFTPISVPRSLSNSHGSTDSFSCTNLAGIEFQSANSTMKDAVLVSTAANHSTASHVSSGGSACGHHEKQNQTELAPGKQMIENDLFQALNMSLTHPGEDMSWNEHITCMLRDAQKNNESQSLRPKSDIFEDARVHPPPGDDLFDVLGVDFKKKLLSSNWNSFPIKEMDIGTGNLGNDPSVLINTKDVCSDRYLVSDGISDSDIFSGTNADHLLDAVVSSVHSAVKQGSEDNVSCRTTLTKVCGSSVPNTSPTYGQISMTKKMQDDLFGLQNAVEKAETAGSSSFRSGSNKDGAGSCSKTNSVYESQISSWVEQGQNLKRDSSVSTAYSKRPDEVGKSNRKRLKPGENPRPRPKDRQMIQDRVKELREIVPNGAKCSIDALLERTIKHMLFLQGVTKHADKLQQTGESKIISKEGGLLLKDNFEGGATWAFEVGSQSMVCPIIVEDLNPPRQMLVEMLCEERGFFLEIADIIRGLGLTILKGVMEVWNDKIWARFAVEANRDVTRMEIFISLVRLLEQTVKSSASPGNVVDDDNMMVHHSFHQPTSIPATGRPGSFQ